MSGLQTFSWCGEPILDPEKWTAERGELMVDVTYERHQRTVEADLSTRLNRFRWWIRERLPIGHPPTEIVEHTVTEVESMPEWFYTHSRLAMGYEMPVSHACRSPKV